MEKHEKLKSIYQHYLLENTAKWIDQSGISLSFDAYMFFKYGFEGIKAICRFDSISEAKDAMEGYKRADEVIDLNKLTPLQWSIVNDLRGKGAHMDVIYLEEKLDF